MTLLVQKVVGFTLVSVMAIAATTAHGSITDDQIRGRVLIQAAAARIGGEEALTELRGLHLLAAGDGFNGLQGAKASEAETEVKIGTNVLEADFDFAGHRYRRKSVQTLPGGIELAALTCFQNGRLTTDYYKGHHSSVSSPPESTIADGLLRLVPALFLQRALRNIQSATFAGEYREGDTSVAFVDVSVDAGNRVRAHISLADYRLIAVESWAMDPLTGDDTAVYRFAGDRIVNGITFPSEVTVFRRGRPYLRLAIRDVKVNPTFQDSLFIAPVEEPLQETFETKVLGNDTYEITGIDGGAFRVIFFDLGDGVAVFDAPESRSRSRAIVAEIHRQLGNKPIKYLVASHFHDDHIAGVGYYVDQGVQIVTVRENASLIKKYAVANSRIRPDLEPSGNSPLFLFVDDAHLTLTGSNTKTLEVRKLPACPHAQNMLVAVVPAESLLVEADLFVELAGPSEASRNLVEWLRRDDAPRIEWVVGPHLRKTSIRSLVDAISAS